ncbi:MAG: hypothetical protein GY795_19430 [Desulfobacterales bacterium]|nr:hypothetical protein [Desulfobacterales bacterium]
MKTENNAVKKGTGQIHILKYIIIILLVTSTYSCTLLKKIGIFQPTRSNKGSYSDISAGKKNPVKNKNIPENTSADPQAETRAAEAEKIKVKENIQQPEVKENIQQAGIKNIKVKVKKDFAGTKVVSETASKKLKPKKSTNRVSVLSKKKSARINMKKLTVFNCKASDKTIIQANDKTIIQDDNTSTFFSKYSKKLGIPFDGTENIQLIMAVDEWLGTPFKWGGCSKYGIDCSCLVQSIYKNVYGIDLNRTTIGMFTTNLATVEKEDLQEGDLIFFKIRGNKISHVGIYLKHNKFIHSTLTKGVMINDLDQNYYKKRFLSGRRVSDTLHRVTKLSPKTEQPEKKQNSDIVSLNQPRVKTEAGIQDTYSKSTEWMKQSITHHKNFGGLGYASPALYGRAN